MVINELEIAQASIEIVGGFVCVMLAVIIMINGVRQNSLKQLVKMFFTVAPLFLFEALAYIFRGNTDLFSQLVTRVSNLAVFLLNFLLALISTRYIYSILEEKNAVPGKVYIRIVYAAFGAAAAILIVNLFTGWMYYFDDSNYYHRNFAWYIYTLLSLVCLADACVLIFRYRRQLDTASLFSLLLYELFPLVGVVIQSFYYGLSFINLGIGISVILVLIAYLISWNRSDGEDRAMTQLRRSYETTILFIIMVVSISASIVSCIVSIRRVSHNMSVSSSQVIAHVISDHIDNMLLRPITVTETMSKDYVLQDYFRRSGEEDPAAVEDEMSAYLESIRTGFGYQMVYAVCESSRVYYTCNGIVKTVDPTVDPTDRWYQDFLDSGKYCMLKVDTDQANNWDLSVFVNTAVPGTDGTLLGVCGIGLEMSYLQEQLSLFEKQYNIRITLCDPSGLVQIDSDSSRIETDRLMLPDLSNISSDGIYHEELNGYDRMTKYMEELDWYLIIDNLSPDRVHILQILLPNIFIFLTGLFMLAVAYSVIMIRERKISGELIEKRRTSLYDELTGLRNRRAFEEDCRRITAEGSVRDVTVVMIDLNSLKFVNDTLGHQAGDELIQAAAQCMAAALLQYGGVYRTGGDEFLALLNCPADTLACAMQNFDQMTKNWNGRQIRSISVARGIAAGADHPDLSLGDLIALADRLMYEDKNEYYRKNGIDRRRYPH